MEHTGAIPRHAAIRAAAAAAGVRIVPRAGGPSEGIGALPRWPA